MLVRNHEYPQQIEVGRVTVRAPVGQVGSLHCTAARNPHYVQTFSTNFRRRRGQPGPVGQGVPETLFATFLTIARSQILAAVFECVSVGGLGM